MTHRTAIKTYQREALSIGDEVFHREFGDGEVLSCYGANKLSVRFGEFGLKRVPVESVSKDPAMCNHGLANLLADIAQDKARAETATIIPFPGHRIVRRIEYGNVVEQQSPDAAA